MSTQTALEADEHERRHARTPTLLPARYDLEVASAVVGVARVPLGYS